MTYNLKRPGLITYKIDLNAERALAIAMAEVVAVLVILFPEAAPVLVPTGLGLAY